MVVMRRVLEDAGTAVFALHLEPKCSIRRSHGAVMFGYKF